MSSPAFKFDTTDARKLGMGAVIAGAGAIMAYLGEWLTNQDFGQYGPVVGAIWAVVFNAFRKWASDNRVASIILVSTLLYSSSAIAAEYKLVGQTPDTCNRSYSLCAQSDEKTGKYPVRTRWWTVGGRYPSHSEMVRHLQQGEHRGKWDPKWLQSLTYEEIHSLHSDDHEGKAEVTFASRDYVLSSGVTRVIVVTSASCTPCKRWYAVEQPKLASRGIVFGKQLEKRSSYPGVRLVPSYIVTVDGKPVRRITGYQTAAQVESMLKTKIVPSKQVTRRQNTNVFRSITNGIGRTIFR